MSKRLLLVIIIAVLIAGGTMYLLLTKDETTADEATNSSQQRTSQTNSQKTDTGSNATTTEGGKYIDYSEEAIANTDGTKLLFFHASWCPQCRALDADIRDKGVPANVVILKVDYDSNQDLRQKYGVTIQTTVVKVDNNGNLVEKFVAYDDPSLAAVTKELL